MASLIRYKDDFGEEKELFNRLITYFINEHDELPQELLVEFCRLYGLGGLEEAVGYIFEFLITPLIRGLIVWSLDSKEIEQGWSEFILALKTQTEYMTLNEIKKANYEDILRNKKDD